MEPVDQFRAIIGIIEAKPDDVERLRSWLCLICGNLRGSPNKTQLDHLLIDALSRELGFNDLSLARFKRDFEAMGHPFSD